LVDVGEKISREELEKEGFIYRYRQTIDDLFVFMKKIRKDGKNQYISVFWDPKTEKVILIAPKNFTFSES
jgi:hypothetical protein